MRQPEDPTEPKDGVIELPARPILPPDPLAAVPTEVWFDFGQLAHRLPFRRR